MTRFTTLQQLIFKSFSHWKINRSKPVSLSLPDTPLYELSPLPWWTRWTYFLVATDAIFTVGACELTWSHWTTATESSSDSNPEPVFTLRPWWQRLGAVAAQGLVGSYLATMIIAGRTHIIRRLWVLPSVPVTTNVSIPKAQTGARHVLIQSVHHSDFQGQLYPYNSCKFQDQKTPRNSVQREMLLKIDGVRQFYSLQLEGAKINGERPKSSGRHVSEDFRWIRQELQDAWRVEGGARRSRHKFKSGPVVGIPR